MSLNILTLPELLLRFVVLKDDLSFLLDDDFAFLLIATIFLIPESINKLDELPEDCKVLL